ncbi:MAG: hypothetical protein IPJ77_05980 [Planctomycetes bacterium]|nr:hypothetical protein [Planctomycetota bacterium]
MKIPLLAVLGTLTFLGTLGSCAATSSASADTSADVKLPPYNGPKARIVIDAFEWGVSQSGYEVTSEYEDEDGDRRRTTWSSRGSNVTSGLEASLKQSLMSTDRFIVADRKGIKKFKDELKLKEEGFMRSENAPEKGQIHGADLLVRGTVLEWEEDAGGSGGGGGFLGGIIPGMGGGLFSSEKGKCVIQVEIIDLNSMDTLVSQQVKGEAKSTSFGLGAIGWTGSAVLGGVFSEYEKKPMGQAIRQAIAESIRLIAARVPQSYYKHG